MVPRTDILTDVKQENAFHCNSFCGIKNWSDLKSGVRESKLTCLDRLMISFTFDYRCIHLFVWMSKHNMLNISKLYNMLKFKQKGKTFFFLSETVLNTHRWRTILCFCVCQVQIVCFETLCGILFMNFDLVFEEKLWMYYCCVAISYHIRCYWQDRYADGQIY